MEAKLIAYNVVIMPGRAFSALVALLHGFWAVSSEHMWEITIIIVNLEKVVVVCWAHWASHAQGAGQSLGLCKSVARVRADLAFGS